MARFGAERLRMVSSLFWVTVSPAGTHPSVTTPVTTVSSAPTVSRELTSALRGHVTASRGCFPFPGGPQACQVVQPCSGPPHNTVPRSRTPYGSAVQDKAESGLKGWASIWRRDSGIRPVAETADESWKAEGGGGQPADTAPGRQAEAEVWGGGRRDAPVAPIPHPGEP